MFPSSSHTGSHALWASPGQQQHGQHMQFQTTSGPAGIMLPQYAAASLASSVGPFVDTMSQMRTPMSSIGPVSSMQAAASMSAPTTPFASSNMAHAGPMSHAGMRPSTSNATIGDIMVLKQELQRLQLLAKEKRAATSAGASAARTTSGTSDATSTTTTSMPRAPPPPPAPTLSLDFVRAPTLDAQLSASASSRHDQSAFAGSSSHASMLEMRSLSKPRMTSAAGSERSSYEQGPWPNSPKTSSTTATTATAAELCSRADSGEGLVGRQSGGIGPSRLSRELLRDQQLGDFAPSRMQDTAEAAAAIRSRRSTPPHSPSFHSPGARSAGGYNAVESPSSAQASIRRLVSAPHSELDADADAALSSLGSPLVTNLSHEGGRGPGGLDAAAAAAIAAVERERGLEEKLAVAKQKLLELSAKAPPVPASITPQVSIEELRAANLKRSTSRRVGPARRPSMRSMSQLNLNLGAGGPGQWGMNGNNLGSDMAGSSGMGASPPMLGRSMTMSAAQRSPPARFSMDETIFHAPAQAFKPAITGNISGAANNKPQLARSMTMSAAQHSHTLQFSMDESGFHSPSQAVSPAISDGMPGMSDNRPTLARSMTMSAAQHSHPAHFSMDESSFHAPVQPQAAGLPFPDSTASSALYTHQLMRSMTLSAGQLAFPAAGRVNLASSTNFAHSQSLGRPIPGDLLRMSETGSASTRASASSVARSSKRGAYPDFVFRRSRASESDASQYSAVTFQAMQHNADHLAPALQLGRGSTGSRGPRHTYTSGVDDAESWAAGPLAAGFAAVQAVKARESGRDSWASGVLTLDSPSLFMSNGKARPEQVEVNTTGRGSGSQQGVRSTPSQCPPSPSRSAALSLAGLGPTYPAARAPVVPCASDTGSCSTSGPGGSRVADPPGVGAGQSPFGAAGVQRARPHSPLRPQRHAASYTGGADLLAEPAQGSAGSRGAVLDVLKSFGQAPASGIIPRPAGASGPRTVRMDVPNGPAPGEEPAPGITDSLLKHKRALSIHWEAAEDDEGSVTSSSDGGLTINKPRDVMRSARSIVGRSSTGSSAGGDGDDDEGDRGSSAMCASSAMRGAQRAVLGSGQVQLGDGAGARPAADQTISLHAVRSVRSARGTARVAFQEPDADAGVGAGASEGGEGVVAVGGVGAEDSADEESGSQASSYSYRIRSGASSTSSDSFERRYGMRLSHYRAVSAHFKAERLTVKADELRARTNSRQASLRYASLSFRSTPSSPRPVGQWVETDVAVAAPPEETIAEEQQHLDLDLDLEEEDDVQEPAVASATVPDDEAAACDAAATPAAGGPVQDAAAPAIIAAAAAAAAAAPAAGASKGVGNVAARARWQLLRHVAAAAALAATDAESPTEGPLAGGPAALSGTPASDTEPLGLVGLPCPHQQPQAGNDEKGANDDGASDLLTLPLPPRPAGPTALTQGQPNCNTAASAPVSREVGPLLGTQVGAGTGDTGGAGGTAAAAAATGAEARAAAAAVGRDASLPAAKATVRDAASAAALPAAPQATQPAAPSPPALEVTVALDPSSFPQDSCSGPAQATADAAHGPVVGRRASQSLLNAVGGSSRQGHGRPSLDLAISLAAGKWDEEAGEAPPGPSVASTVEAGQEVGGGGRQDAAAMCAAAATAPVACIGAAVAAAVPAALAPASPPVIVTEPTPAPAAAEQQPAPVSAQQLAAASLPLASGRTPASAAPTPASSAAPAPAQPVPVQSPTVEPVAAPAAQPPVLDPPVPTLSAPTAEPLKASVDTLAATVAATLAKWEAIAAQLLAPVSVTAAAGSAQPARAASPPVAVVPAATPPQPPIQAEPAAAGEQGDTGVLLEEESTVVIAAAANTVASASELAAPCEVPGAAAAPLPALDVQPNAKAFGSVAAAASAPVLPAPAPAADEEAAVAGSQVVVGQSEAAVEEVVDDVAVEVGEDLQDTSEYWSEEEGAVEEEAAQPRLAPAPIVITASPPGVPAPAAAGRLLNGHAQLWDGARGEQLATQQAVQQQEAVQQAEQQEEERVPTPHAAVARSRSGSSHSSLGMRRSLEEAVRSAVARWELEADGVEVVEGQQLVPICEAADDDPLGQPALRPAAAAGAVIAASPGAVLGVAGAQAAVGSAGNGGRGVGDSIAAEMKGMPAAAAPLLEGLRPINTIAATAAATATATAGSDCSRGSLSSGSTASPSASNKRAATPRIALASHAIPLDVSNSACDASEAT